jgi:hypothetical protein
MNSLIGEFDVTAITEALKAISVGALKTSAPGNMEALRVSFKREDHEARPTAVIEWQPVYFRNGDPFRSFNGSDAIRMSLAAKIIEAHDGLAEHQNSLLRVRLPLAQ